MKISLLLIPAILLTNVCAFAHEGHDDKEPIAAGETKTVSGEVVDLVCYVDHNASGEKHAGCAKKCITSNLPVGLKADDGKLYVVVGEHMPMNAELAAYAGKKITLSGKVVARDGINVIENAEIKK